MLAQLTPKERLVYAAAIAILLFVAGYVGAQHLKKPPEINIRNGVADSLGVSGSSPSSQPLAAGPSTALVHVAGAVKEPRVVRLSPEARVVDAIQAAGGALQDADLDQLNLAARVVDGTQLYVPRKGEIPSNGPPVQEAYRGGRTADAPYSARPVPSASSGSRALKGLPAPASISLNSASAAELERLPGVGPATAAKILEYRREHGGFSSLDELLAVKGIGPKKLADMRPYLRL